MNGQVTSSPHLHSGESIRGIMLDVIFALVPAGIAGVFFFGIRALMIILVSVATCVLCEMLWQWLLKKPISIGDMSAVVTGLLLAYNLPPTLPLWMAVLGAAFAIIIAKQVFGGLGHNFINPALAGRAFLLAAFAGDMTSWVSASLFGMDAQSTATPLALLKAGNLSEMPEMLQLILGNIGGCIGETSSILLLLGGLYLLARRVIKLRIPAAFIGTVAVLAFIFGTDGGFMQRLQVTGYHLFSGGLFLGAFFMATDYTTTPSTPLGQLLFGIGCGLITCVIRFIGGYPEGVSYSILIMNVAAPLIERHTMPRVYGHERKKWPWSKKGGAEAI